MDEDNLLPRIRWYTYFKNKLSIVGLLIAAVAGIFHLSMVFLDISAGTYNPYLNIWFYILLPPFVIFGLALALFGAWRVRRQIRMFGLTDKTLVRMQTRKLLVVSGLLSFLLLIPFLGFTTYAGYHYTDSVEFCGQICHTPMNPVFTAYQVSPHARVSCSSCHIGEGASWFVRSKLSGTRQVVATALDTFHRPIATPIKNLRPAKETCERCHWPEKAFGSKVVDLPHYASDEGNTYRPLTMVLKTGGGDPAFRPVRGIHWHLLSTHRTEYVAVDGKRLEIPWVKVVTEEGERVFRSDGLPEDAPPPEGELRVMDCLDCHNRPSHHYLTPDEVLNKFFSYGLLDPSIPYLKREAARLMTERYEDTPSARSAISEGLKAFYEKNYPEIAAGKEKELDAAVDVVLKGFERNFFPEMKTDWRTNPDHIGHKYFPGCYRCHDDRHVAADGAVISRDCGLCHEFMENKEVEGGKALVQGGYHHPYPLEESHENIDCHQCHDGGPTPPPTCAGCHSDIADFLAGHGEILPGFSGEPDPHHGELECIDCHEAGRSIPPDMIVSLCEDCHDDGYGEAMDAKVSEIRNARSERNGTGPSGAAGPSPLETALNPDALDRLEKRYSVHNIAYALEIIGRLKEAEATGKN